MTLISRRQFSTGASGTLAALSLPLSVPAFAQGSAKVVVVGGGAGGATVANALKRGEPKLDVTLIEVNPVYFTCFFSNLYLGGFRTYQSLQHNYDGLKKLGIKVVFDTATDIDATKKEVKTKGGKTFGYDRLVLSPGIDLKYNTIEGYSEQASLAMPHAWKPGPQTLLLKTQLEKMKDGGTVVMAVPNNPFRCPPGPYERICMISHFLKTKKPKSKLVVFDAKKNFSKQPVFVEAFDKYYKGIIELNLSTEFDDFTVVRVDPKSGDVVTKGGKTVKADVANIVPNQRAGEIAHKAGVTEGDWAPVNPENFSSKKVKDMYVLGDATIAAEMPKSSFAANSQAKVVAADILADLAKKERFPARFRNTCWSMVAPDDGVKIGANYTPKDGKLDPSGGFVSKPGEDAALRKQTFEESLGWYSGIVADIFAKAEPAASAAGKKKA